MQTQTEQTKWILTIDGEGDARASIHAATETEAAKQAEAYIAKGDWDLAPGESVTVRYYLTPVVGGVRGESGDLRKTTITG